MTCLHWLPLLALLASPAYAAVDFVNYFVVPGEGSDLFNVTGTNYAAGAASSRFGAYFSDLEYDQATGEWYGLADRGPGGGVYPYASRVQVLNIDLNTATGAIRNITLKRTVPFRMGAAFFDGQSPDRLNGNGSVLGMSFDAEGITVSRTGNLLVSDEYEPAIVEFTPTGQFVRRFTQPANLRPTRADGATDYATGTLASGRQDNRGYEGLAITPDGSQVCGMLQDPLAEEGRNTNNNNIDGRWSQNIRIVCFNVASGMPVGQYIYQLESLASINTRLPAANQFTNPSNSQGRSIGISAIIALTATRFLVLERDNRGFGAENSPPPATSGTPGSKRVYLVDITGATDVSAVSLAGVNALPNTVTPVTKTLFLDIQAELQSRNLLVPEKLEGITIGPQLANGKYVIIIGTDNDMSVSQNGQNQQFDQCFSYNASTWARVGTQAQYTFSAGCPSGAALLPTYAYSFTADPADLQGIVPQVREETLSLSVAQPFVVEGNTGSKTVTVTVTLSAALLTSVNVTVTSVAGSTATSGTDFNALNTVVVIPVGSTTATVSVVILGDRVFEPNEVIKVGMINPSAGAIITTGSGATVDITIMNDDGTASASLEFVNYVVIPGENTDLFSDPQYTGANANRFGGYFSDLYFDRARNDWWSVSDRGPGGGVVDYATRVQDLNLNVDPTTGALPSAASGITIQKTVAFKENANYFRGLNAQLLNNNVGVLGLSFDPEGVVTGPNGNLFVSDEYGPSVVEFTPAGAFVRRFTPPTNVLAIRSGAPDFSGTASPSSGRQENRGYEGLAITPDGTTLYAMLQDPLAEEGSGSGVPGRSSRNVRIVAYSVATGASTAQYIYQLEAIAEINNRLGNTGTFGSTAQGRSIGISAIIALDATRFLVIERDNRGMGIENDPAPATSGRVGTKRVFLVDITGATNVAAISLAGVNMLPNTVTPVTKTLFFDIQAELEQRNLLVPEKLEGITIGPQLPNGRYTIYVGTDNDYSVTQTGQGVQNDICFTFNASSWSRDSTLFTFGAGCPSGMALMPTYLYAFTLPAAQLQYVAPTSNTAQASIRSGVASIVEGNVGTKNVTLTVTLSNPLPSDASFILATTGTATLGADYTLNPILLVPAGQMSVTAVLGVIADKIMEADETVIVTLTTPPGSSVIIASASAQVIIANDDGLASPNLELVNYITMPSEGRDLFNASGTANDNRFGAFFSDLAYDAATNEYYAVADRGPGGGVIPYLSRTQVLNFDLNPTSGAVNGYTLLRTVMFTQNGSNFNGLNAMLLNGNASVLGLSLDPEGIVMTRMGNILVSDEYEPAIIEFSKTGTFIRRFTVPTNLLAIRGGSRDYSGENSPDSGRQENRGYEGLAITPDGTLVYAMLQDPLRQEGQPNGRSSRNIRIVAYNVASGLPVAQYIYQIESLASINGRLAPADAFTTTAQGRNIGISAIIALDATRFLVIERDNRGMGIDNLPNDPSGRPGTKRVYLVNIANATDVSSVSLAGSNSVPPNEVPVTKTLFFDIQAELEQRNLLIPEKFEGITIGPRTTDGKVVILVGTDNDMGVTQSGSGQQFDICFNFTASTWSKSPSEVPIGAGCPTGFALLPSYLYAFTLPLSDLRGYVNQVREETINLRAVNSSVIEGSAGTKNISIDVVLSAALAYDVSVTVATVSGGTATPGVDYQAQSQTVTILKGQTTGRFTVVVFGDTISEPDETIVVAMTSPSPGVVLGTTTSATVTITNDDALEMMLYYPPAVKVRRTGVVQITVTNPFNSTVSDVVVMLSVPAKVNLFGWAPRPTNRAGNPPPATYAFVPFNLAPGTSRMFEFKFLVKPGPTSVTFTAKAQLGSYELVKAFSVLVIA